MYKFLHDKLDLLLRDVTFEAPIKKRDIFDMYYLPNVRIRSPPNVYLSHLHQYTHFIL